jgi:alternate signal-mediated exported protein
MNKMVKGSVAGAAGIALLMGGFGTYALWSDATQIGGEDQRVASGKLDIVSSSASWTDLAPVSDNDPATDDTKWSATSDFMVPGDHVALDQTITMDAVGKNLRVKFKITGLNFDADAVAGWSDLNIVAKYGTPGSMQQLVPDSEDVNSFVLTGPASTFDGTKHLVLDFNWPDDANVQPQTTGTSQQGKTISLANLGIAVNQFR